MKDIVAYIPGDLGIVDTINPITGKSPCMGEDITALRVRYPGAILCSWDFAMAGINEAKKEKFPLLRPIEVTEDQFYEAFECLPPMQLRSSDKGMSFKMSEMTYCDVTACYVKKGEKYYTMNGLLKTTHEELINCIN